MPKAPASLVKNTLASPPFAKARKAQTLLKLLYENRDRFVRGHEIAKALWDQSENAYDGQQVRERINDLRKRLREIEEVTESANYFQVETQVGDGYRLILGHRSALQGSAAFWRPHTRADDVPLIYAEPAFFFDPANSLFLRYLDTNPSDFHSPFAELNTKHGRDIRKLYGPDFEKKLVPRSVYLGAGEVAALDLLGEWFLRVSFLKVGKEASSRVTGIQEGSPILVGSQRTNRLIRTLLLSEEAQHFAYKPHDRLGFVAIHEADDVKELTPLGKRFLIDKDEKGRTIVGNGPSLSTTRDRLAVLHRMPTPGGRGTITMISCDTSLAIRQVAFALTDDSQARKIMDATQWTEQTLPKSLEMLFGVKVAPANIDHEAGLAELLAWRGYV